MVDIFETIEGGGVALNEIYVGIFFLFFVVVIFETTEGTEGESH